MGADSRRDPLPRAWWRARRDALTCVVVAGLLFIGSACATRSPTVLLRAASTPTARVEPPALLLGTFDDDYGSRYELSAERFVHGTRSVYHIVEWHVDEQFFVAQNAAENPSDGGLWTRIDWLTFTDQGPFGWGYCFTTYRAATREAARDTPPADRRAPRSGCNGFPFSRMRRASPS